MKLIFTVEVEVSKTSGKFASKEEVEAQVQVLLEEANASDVTVGDSEYTIDDWQVTPI